MFNKRDVCFCCGGPVTEYSYVNSPRSSNNRFLLDFVGASCETCWKSPAKGFFSKLLHRFRQLDMSMPYVFHQSGVRIVLIGRSLADPERLFQAEFPKWSLAALAETDHQTYWWRLELQDDSPFLTQDYLFDLLSNQE